MMKIKPTTKAWNDGYLTGMRWSTNALPLSYIHRVPEKYFTSTDHIDWFEGWFRGAREASSENTICPSLIEKE